jgi:hypothetical protein
VPAFGLAGALFVSVVLAVIALRLWLRTRHVRDVLYSVTVSAIAGSAVLFVGLFVSGMRHYGGQGACSVWWQEAGLPSSAHGIEGDASDRCRQRAIDAIGPAVFDSGLAGIVGGLVVFGAQSVRRRSRPDGRTDNVET